MSQEVQDRDAASSQFLTRRQAAKRFNRSLKFVRDLEKKKRLHPIRRAIHQGAYKFVFREAEVEQIARELHYIATQNMPELRDQAAFNDFAAGKTVVDVVRERGIDSATVERLWIRYCKYSPQPETRGAAALEEDDEELRRQIDRDLERAPRAVPTFDDLRRRREQQTTRRARRSQGDA